MGILNKTDETSGSKLAEQPGESVNACQKMFPNPKRTIDTTTITGYENLLVTGEKRYREFLIKSIESSKSSQIKDKYDIIKDIYQHILKTHLYSPEIFTEKTRSSLSEQDYTIKLWGYLIETIFRSTQILPHWGDTISPFSSKLGILAKMDL
jgi:hypothetical protein